MIGYLGAVQAAPLLAELAEADPSVVLVSQDLGLLYGFSERFPERHFDVGISEQNLVGVAAGLAHAGMRPFVLAMAPFLSIRGFEQIRTDCAYNRNRVVFLAPFAGLEAGSWGATHHAIEDLALMRTIPGMTVLSPADPAELIRAVRVAAEIDGPVYVRIGGIQPIEGYDVPFELGRMVRIRDGDRATLLATGPSVAVALEVHDRLAADGIETRVLNVHTVKPLDDDPILAAARETGRLVTIEEHSIIGGLGGTVAEILAERGELGQLHRIGVRDVFCTEIGPYEELLRIHGLDADGVERSVREFVA